jgi:hypothetical protein
VYDDDPLDDTAQIEHLLSWLWACERKMVPASKLSDPIYDTLLVTRLRGIRSKLDNPNQTSTTHTRSQDNPARTGAPFNRSDNSTARRPSEVNEVARQGRVATDGLSDLALTTKEIAEVLERMETNRRQEHKEKENDKSFLRNLGTMQRELFTTLGTDKLGEIPEHPTFLKNLMDTKTPLGCPISLAQDGGIATPLCWQNDLKMRICLAQSLSTTPWTETYKCSLPSYPDGVLTNHVP